MNRSSVRLWLFTPLLVGVSAFALRLWLAEFGPKADVPDSLNLGTHPSGSRFEAEVPVRNVGRAPLRIAEFWTSCGAYVAFLGRSSSGRSPDAIEIPAGETRRLRVSVAAAGLAGQAIRREIRFQTNDPHRPVVCTELLVSIEGGLSPIPSSLDLPSLPRGGVTARTVEVHDTGLTTPLAVRRVASTKPEEIRILSVTYPGELVDAAKRQLGRVVCRAEVEIASPPQPGRVDGEVQFFTDDASTPTFVVPVRGELQPAFVLSPATVILPLHVGDGLTFETQCLCRSSDGRPFQLACESPPGGLAVRLRDGGSAKPVHTFAVEWAEGERPKGSELAVRVVKFVATHAGGRDEIELTVKCRPPD